ELVHFNGFFIIIINRLACKKSAAVKRTGKINPDQKVSAIIAGDSSVLDNNMLFNNSLRHVNPLIDKVAVQNIAQRIVLQCSLEINIKSARIVCGSKNR